jgi:hypothetical protein
MMWKTHLRITKEVVNRLGLLRLQSVENQRLMDGVIAPDKGRGSQPNHYSHHYGRSAEIKDHLEKARRFFLQNNLPNAYYNLGVALHYIQDSFTSRNISKQAHISWEKRIEDSPLVYNIEEMIQTTVNNEIQRKRCSGFVLALSKEVQGREDTFGIATLSGKYEYPLVASPEVELYLGFWASFFVSKSILSPKNCPTLENIFLKHEKLLRMEEIDLSNKIIGLISKRDKLVTKKVPPGRMVAKIKNWVTDRRIESIDRGAISNKKRYFSGDHLGNVVKHYLIEANSMIASHHGWYSPQILRININIVPRELLEIQAVSKTLGFDQLNLRGLLKENNVSIHLVGNSEVVRRKDLDGLLGQIPINNFVRYPV